MANPIMNKNMIMISDRTLLKEATRLVNFFSSYFQLKFKNRSTRKLNSIKINQ